MRRVRGEGVLAYPGRPAGMSASTQVARPRPPRRGRSPGRSQQRP